MDNVKLRRYENLLIMSGTGVIAFGAWSVIKTILIFTLQNNNLTDSLSDEPGGTFFITLFYILLGIMMLTALIVRLFIGLSARSEGLKKKNRYAYLVFSFILFAVNLTTLIFGFDPRLYNSIFDMAVTVIVDLTSIITLTEMIAASFMVKKLRKKVKEG